MYYVMTCTDPKIGYLATLEYDFSVDPDPLRDWMSGETFEISPVVPITTTIIELTNTVLPEFWQVPLPIMSKRMYETLLQADVTNLETYPAELIHSNGTVDNRFVAFNIIGLVKADTVITSSSDTELIDGFLLNNSPKQKLDLFRLENAVNTIVVHESVKLALEAAGINTLSFYETADWST
jgi:hypothetical protein